VVISSLSAATVDLPVVRYAATDATNDPDRFAIYFYRKTTEGDRMSKLTFLALRIVLAGGLVGSVFVQAVLVPLLASDMKGADQEVLDLRVPLIVIVVLGIVTIQVSMVCVWRLLTMVRRGTVFSNAAFRYVDVVIGAIAAASLLMFGLGVVLAPGEAVAPGVVLLVGGAAVLIAGVALIVVVMRMLLTQAVARDAEAHHLQAELDEVI